MANERLQQYYDLRAEEYALRYFRELEDKPFDRLALKRFHEETRDRGTVCDMGCGPGEIAALLASLGASVAGVDASEKMLEQARKLCPGVTFYREDMADLHFHDGELAGIAAFYAIVHSLPPGLERIFSEWRRVTRPGGLLLLSFHAGEGSVHVDEEQGIPVDVDFYFLDPHAVALALERAGYTVRELHVRDPYPGVEYASRRCYIFAVV